jgi:hypothetical protein
VEQEEVKLVKDKVKIKEGKPYKKQLGLDENFIKYCIDVEE